MYVRYCYDCTKLSGAAISFAYFIHEQQWPIRRYISELYCNINPNTRFCILGLSSLLSYCYKLTTLKIEFSVIKLDAAKFNNEMMPFSVNLKELSLYKSVFVDTSNTFPMLEDVLFLCTNLKTLKLAKPTREDEKIEKVYPFVTALPNYEKIIELV